MLTIRPPLTTALTLPLTLPPSLQIGQDAVPVLLELGLLVGEDDVAFLVLELLDQHVDLVADLDGREVLKFVSGTTPSLL